MPVVSVCMATYNGGRYVREQLESILDQLGPDDEVVVVDDASTDDTRSVVVSIGDPRIRLEARTSNRGVSDTFERALSLARGDVILLADQDDRWVPGRLALMCAALDDADLVAGNAVDLDLGDVVRPPGTGAWFRLHDADPAPRARSVALLLLSQLPYHGCAMGFRRELVEAALPFPASAGELHDAWLGLVGLTGWRVRHLAAPVVRRRLHDHNATGRVRGVGAVLRGRWLALRMLQEARRRRPRRRPPGASVPLGW